MKKERKTLRDNCFITDDMTQEDILSRYMKKLGYENLKECIPFTIERIKEVLDKGDDELSSLSIRIWAMGAGFLLCEKNACLPISSKLRTLILSSGANDYTLEEGIGILKKTAIKWARESKTHF